MNPLFFRDFFWGLVYMFIQIVLVRHLRLFEAQPDIFWLYLIYLASVRQRTYVLLTAGVLTFIYDALLDLWGLHLFAFTATLFIIHQFLPRIQEQKLLTVQASSFIFVSALISNVFISGLSSFTDLYSSNVFFWQLLIGNSLYTALLGSFLYNFSSVTQGNS